MTISNRDYKSAESNISKKQPVKTQAASGGSQKEKKEEKDSGGGDSEEDGSSLKSKRKLLTIKQLAEFLSVPVSWLYQRTRLGPSAIPHYKMGKYVRFDADEVVAFLRDKNSDERAA